MTTPSNDTPEATDEQPEVVLAPALVIRPGDRVLVALNQTLTAENAGHLARRLETRYPGTEVTVLADVASLAVMPAAVRIATPPRPARPDLSAPPPMAGQQVTRRRAR